MPCSGMTGPRKVLGSGMVWLAKLLALSCVGLRQGDSSKYCGEDEMIRVPCCVLFCLFPPRDSGAAERQLLSLSTMVPFSPRSSSAPLFPLDMIQVPGAGWG